MLAIGGTEAVGNLTEQNERVRQRMNTGIGKAQT